MKRFFPLLTIVAIALVAYWGWCVWRGQTPGKGITGMIGWSPYNTSPMPSSPAPSSNVQGVNIQAR